jgi:hypothetical protein
MPRQLPRHRTDGGRDPRESSGDSCSLDKPPDLSDMGTTYLVLPEPLQGIQASREKQLTAHQAFGNHLRAQQRALMRQAVDWQSQMCVERLADRRAEIQLQIDNLWGLWDELERQIRAHRQAMRALREPHPHA